MATTFTVPTTPLSIGETPFGPFSVPSGVAGIELHFPPRGLFNNTGGFQFLSQLWIDVSLDGGTTWSSPTPSTPGAFGTGIFSDPTFVDGKTGSTTDVVSRWTPIPSPCQIRLRAVTVVPFSLAGASIVVS